MLCDSPSRWISPLSPCSSCAWLWFAASGQYQGRHCGCVTPSRTSGASPLFRRDSSHANLPDVSNYHISYPSIFMRCREALWRHAKSDLRLGSLPYSSFRPTSIPSVLALLCTYIVQVVHGSPSARETRLGNGRQQRLLSRKLQRSGSPSRHSPACH